jgi:O-antigen/teichoic acid export membrane protein
MGIANAVVRYYYEFSEQEKREQVISVALITVWVVSLTFFALSVVFSKNISNLVFKSPDYYFMLEIIFASTVINLSNEIPLNILRIEQKSVFYVVISVLKTAMTLTLNIIFIVYFKMGLIGILLSSLITTAIMGVFLLVYQIRKIKMSYSIALLKPMLGYSIPIVWSSLGLFIVNFADRFFLQRLTTLSELGIYSLAYRFGFLPIVILGPFMSVWGPKRFDIEKEPNAKAVFSVILTYLLFILIYTGLGICILIKDVITIMADPKFIDAYKYVSILLLAYILNGIVFYIQFGIHLAKKTKHLAYATFIAAGINIAANLLLIPSLRAWGAAIATLLSFMFMLGYVHIISQKLYHIPYEYGRIIKMSLIALALYAVGSLINPSNIAVSIIVKFLIAFSFPFVLYIFRFYTPEEKAKVSQIFKQLYGFVKLKISKGTT